MLGKVKLDFRVFSSPHTRPATRPTTPAPTRSAIFNAGQTSRINVAHFMADLLTDDTRWSAWSGQMPVLYNRD